MSALLETLWFEVVFSKMAAIKLRFGHGRVKDSGRGIPQNKMLLFLPMEPMEPMGAFICQL
jgi:hypothetical protein